MIFMKTWKIKTEEFSKLEKFCKTDNISYWKQWRLKEKFVSVYQIASQYFSMQQKKEINLFSVKFWHPIEELLEWRDHLSH